MFTRQSNPFLSNFAAADPASEARIAFLGSALEISADELERADADELEVVVLWGTNVVATRHLGREGSVVVGDTAASLVRIPSEALGAEAFTLATGSPDGFVVRIPAGACAVLHAAGKGVREIVGPSHAVTARGDRITVELGAFSLRVAHVAAGKRLRAPAWMARVRDSALLQVLGAAFLHAALLGAFGSSRPGLANEDGSDAQMDQAARMMPYLVSAAEREKDEERDQADTSEASGGERAPSGGGRAQGSEGAMGKEHATTHGRYAFAGPKDNPDPRLLRDQALRDAATFGLIGALQSSSSDPNAPRALFGAPDAQGVDPRSALGAMFGSTIDDAAGSGGLGLSGIGEGGGGKNEGVGLNEIGGLGHFFGPGGTGPGGFGQPGGIGACEAGRPCRMRGHDTGAPQVRMAQGTEVNGQIPREVIQRIVRQNFGRFRSCYEAGLRDNPSLAGRVVTRFTVSREGTVTSSVNGHGDLPSADVTSCVTRAFYGLTFPEHDVGIVTVVYPLVFSPM